jgi:hypothetical protein
MRESLGVEKVDGNSRGRPPVGQMDTIQSTKQSSIPRPTRPVITGVLSMLVYGLATLLGQTSAPFLLVFILMSLPGTVIISAIALISQDTSIFIIACCLTSAAFWYLAGIISARVAQRPLSTIAVWFVIAIAEVLGFGFLWLLYFMGVD